MADNKSKQTSQPISRVQKGAFVVPSEGPHKGMRHKVTHIHDDGSVNLVPWDLHPSRVKYRLGAVRAQAHQYEAIKEEMEIVDEAAPNHPIPDMVRMHLPPHMVDEYDKYKKQRDIQNHLDREYLEKKKKGKLTEMDERELHNITKQEGRNLLQNHIEKVDSNQSLDESANKAYVKPHTEKGSTKQVGWKASNKHGKVKYYGMEFKSSAHKHAGINEDQQIDELSRGTLGRYVKSAGPDKERRQENARQLSSVGHDMKADGEHEKAKELFHRAGKEVHKAANRGAGIRKAVDKLVKEDNVISEAKRGRPSKATAENQEHVVMQLRKNISMNGSKPIKFADGAEHTISSSHAGRVLDHYDSLKPDAKDAFQKHIGSNHRNLTDWIGGKKFEHKVEINKPSNREINNDEIFGHKGIRESSTLRTVKSLAHRRHQEQRQNFRRKVAEIIANA